MISSIDLEPSSESGVPVFMPLKSFLRSLPVRIDDNSLLLRKMDCKVQNTELMILDMKEVMAPGCLTATDIVCIQVVPNLIMGSAKLHGGTIVALIDILVDVLDGFD
jgi:hypothetical protein